MKFLHAAIHFVTGNELYCCPVFMFLMTQDFETDPFGRLFFFNDRAGRAVFFCPSGTEIFLVFKNVRIRETASGGKAIPSR